MNSDHALAKRAACDLSSRGVFATAPDEHVHAAHNALVRVCGSVALVVTERDEGALLYRTAHEANLAIGALIAALAALAGSG